LNNCRDKGFDLCSCRKKCFHDKVI
jgi:hypothetical protein